MRCPIPITEFDASLGAAETAVSLPPETYSSPEFYRFELAAIWGHEWFCVGRATDIPAPGDYFTVTVGDDPLVVVRDAGGDVRVLANVCRHRAMRVAEGTDNARRFRCPYHSWVYRLDGTLQSAPELGDAPCFDKSEIRLPEIRSAIWEGFVFVTFDPDLPPLSGRLGRLGAQLANWGLGELRAARPQQFTRYDFNWKIFGDECYHCQHLHARTWHQMYPTPSQRIDHRSALTDEANGIIAYELAGEGEGSSPTRTGQVTQPMLPGLTAEQRARLCYVTVAPNLLIIAMPDKVKCFLWLPAGPAAVRFAATWLYPEPTLARPEFETEWKREADDLAAVMREDEYAWHGVQQGMRSRFAPRGRYAPSEEFLVKLNHWLIGKYRAENQRG